MRKALLRSVLVCLSLLTVSSAAKSQVTGEDGAVRACEARIISTLRSPASYRPVKVTIYANGVEVIYDSSNAYGALLRDKETCVFVAGTSGLYFADDPAGTLDGGLSQCREKVAGWISKGNLTERAAAPFYEDCNKQVTAYAKRWKTEFQDLDVIYPVLPASTTIRP